MEKLISPIHPVRQFQLDHNLRQKAAHVRERFGNKLATVGYDNGAEMELLPFDFNIPLTETTTVQDIQAQIYKTTREIQETEQFVLFWDGPRQMFSFDPPLAEMLSYTEVGDVPWEAVRLPYDEFYLHFGCVLRESLNFQGRKYKADGAYVRAQKGASVVDSFLDGALHIIVTTKLVEPAYEQAVDAFSGSFSFKEPVYWMTVSGQSGDTVASALERGRSGQIKLAQGLDNCTYESALNMAKEQGISSVSAFNIQAEEGRFSRGEKLTTEALPLLFNCIFYLTTLPAPPELTFPVDAPQSLVGKLERTSSQNRKKILSEDLLRRGYTKLRFVREPEAHKESVFTETGKTVRTHWRRGHWRRQPVGVGLKKLVLKWIRPCVVNSDHGEPEVGRMYAVERQN